MSAPAASRGSAPAAASATSAALRVLVQDAGVMRGFAKLEILRDEFDIDHAAAAMLQFEAGRRAMLLGDARAHVGDVDDEAVGIARPRQQLRAMVAITLSASAAGPATGRARVSDICSQVQASSS